MNERQRKFAEYYAAEPNATAAAVAAGYSQKTAYSQGQRLLKNVEVSKRIRELQDEAAESRIASITQIKALWCDLAFDKEQTTKDRLRASELFARSAGVFLPDPKEAGAGEAMIQIFIPHNYRDEIDGQEDE